MQDVFTAARIASPGVRAASVFLVVAERERLLRPAGLSGRAILLLARVFTSLPIAVQEFLGRVFLYSLALLYVGVQTVRRRPATAATGALVAAVVVWRAVLRRRREKRRKGRET